MKILNIGNCVRDATNLNAIRVFGEQGCVNDTSSIVGLAEVRIWVEEENLFELALGKEIREVLHRVRLNDRNILETCKEQTQIQMI
jgi:hypothetical protein